jgi:hypothetical protein
MKTIQSKAVVSHTGLDQLVDDWDTFISLWDSYWNKQTGDDHGRRGAARWLAKHTGYGADDMEEEGGWLYDVLKDFFRDGEYQSALSEQEQADLYVKLTGKTTFLH